MVKLISLLDFKKIVDDSTMSDEQKSDKLAIHIADLIYKNHKKALPYIDVYFDYVNIQKIDKYMGLAYMKYGIYYFHKANYDKALQYYILADKYMSQVDEWNFRIGPKVNIAMVYRRTGHERKALAIYNEVLDDIDENDVRVEHCQVHISCVDPYITIKEYDAAENHARIALKFAQQLEHTFGMAFSYAKLGHCLYYKKNYLLALECIDISDEKCVKNNFDYQYIENCYFRTLILIGLKDYKLALTYSEKGYYLSKKYNNQEDVIRYYECMSIIHTKTKDYKNALKYEKKYAASKIKYIENENNIKFNAIQLQFESEKKEQHIKALKLLRAESELKALRSQMNPHFIFNVLNSIRQMYAEGDIKSGDKQIVNFSELMRDVLHYSSKSKITLEQEVLLLQKYLDIESLRFEKDFIYTIEVAEDIEADFVTIPPMLVQPFIENSIKHGLSHKKGEKRIDVSFSLTQDNVLQCTIADNGIGRKSSSEINHRNKSHQSFSTEATRKRLELLNEKSIINHLEYIDEVDIEGLAIGTTAILHISL